MATLGRELVMMNENFISELTWDEYHKRIPESFLILPVGSTEQHTYHLPLGVDSIIGERFAVAIAKKTNALIAPAVMYGYKSQPTTGGGGSLFPGNIELNADTFVKLIRNILFEFIQDGWLKIMILNSHYENQAFLVEAADLTTFSQNDLYPKIVLTNWWENVSEELFPKLFDEIEFPGWELEHGGILETCLMMYFAPTLVHEDKILNEGVDKVPSYNCFPPPKNFLPESGCMHTARSSSKEKGKLVAENVVKNLLKIIEIEFSE